MANKNIKGITIEIDGNTSGLDKALKSVNNSSVKLNSELKDVNKLLKFDPSNATGLAQKQELLTKAISNTSDKLNQLKSAQSQVEAQFKSGNIGEEQYRAFQREIATTEQSLNGYKSQLSGLQSEQEKLGQNTKRLNTFFEASGKSINDFSDILGTRLVNSINNGTATSDQLEMALNKIGKEALGAGADLNEMKQSLDKVDDGGSIAGVKNDLESLKVTSNSTDEELGKLGTGITQGNLLDATDKIAEVGEKIKEVAAAAQEAFREIDDGMDTFTTTTGQNSDVIKASFDKIYTSMPIESTADLGQALGSLTQQFGFTGDKLTGYGTQLMQFAGINNTDVKSSVDNAKSAIETYGLSYDDLGSVLDTVTAVSQKTGVSVDDLMTKAVEGAPQIKALGLSFGEGTEMLGKFEQAGVDSSDALSSLSKANVVYAKDGKTLQEGLKGTIESIKGAKSQTEALTIASEVFGTKGATRMVDAIQRGTFNLDELGGAAETASGTVKKTFESTEDPIDKQAVALQSAKLSFSELGATIAEGLQPILDALIPIIKSLGKSFANMPDGVKTFVVVLGILVTAFTLLAPFIAAIVTILPVLGAAFAAIGTAVGAVVGVLSGPVIAIIAVVIGVIIGIIAVIKNWGAIVDWLKGVWDGFVGWIGGLWNGMKETASNVWNGMKDTISNVCQSIADFVKGIWQGIKDTTSNIFNGIKDFMSSIWDGIKNIVSNAVNGVKNYVVNVFDGLKLIVTGIWNGIKSIISNVWNGIKIITSNVVNGVKNTVVNVFDGLKLIVTGIWNGIKYAITNPIEAAKNTVSNIINTIKGLFNFSLKFPSISIPHIPLPHFSLSGSFNPLKGQIPSIGIDWYAKGGILTKPTIFGANGNSLMVGGEAGKEAVAPLSDLMAYVEKAVANQIGGMEANFTQMIQLLTIIASKDTSLNMDGKAVMQIIDQHMNTQQQQAEFGIGRM